MDKNKYILKNKKILTTDPEKRIGLYAIRYLGQAGADIDSIAQYDGLTEPLGFLSKYLGNKIYLNKQDFFSQFKEFLVKHSNEYDVVNPIDISKMLCVLDTDKEFSLNCNYLLPKRDSLVIADDKELLTKHTLSVGLKCPKTLFRVSPDTVNDIVPKELTYPCIIKFRGDSRQSHWAPQDRYSIVYSLETLNSEYKRMHEIEEYPIIQEYIHGQGFGFFALYDKNRKIKAQFCHKRIREYPITGGPSSCCEGVSHPELVRTGRFLLESLEWRGLGMVEFKYDENRKDFFILEVNPRYWGSIPLAVLSGVNFPVLHALSALEDDYPPVLDYRVGIKMRFIDKDIKSILCHFLKEASIRKKLGLLLELFNPTIKEGLFTLDDIGVLIKKLVQGRRSHKLY